jgi:hypothetical protein
MFTCIALIGNLRANKQMIGDAHEVADIFAFAGLSKQCQRADRDWLFTLPASLPA